MRTIIPNISIRSTDIRDADTIRALRLEALSSTPTAFGADYEQQKSRPAAYWVDYVTLNPNDGVIHIALNGDKTIGMAGIRRTENPKTRHSAVIWGVYIRPAWRGQNLAKTLIEANLDWARQKDICVVKLAVVTTNLPALRTYEQLGFKIYGTEPQALCYENIFYDEYLMYKEL